MKKRMTLFGILVLVVMAVAFTPFQQKEKGKQNQNGQKQNQAKNQDKPGKGNNGKNGNEQGEGKMEKENKGNNKNDNKDNYKGNGNNGKNEDKNRSSHGNKDGYSWDRESFKERNKIRNKEKVTLCHKFNNEDEPAVTIRVSSNALEAHMNHGDVMGNCPVTTNSGYSDIFLRNRTEYYNSIQHTQEQVMYSRSILDYALERLAASRLQLTTLQNNNMPAADIQRKQATVVELEQNVSLLETLIGVTANIVANKL
jgi:hypothetical protein